MNDQWFYGENGEQRGPISLDELRQRIASGQTRADDLVWRDGMPAWTTISAVPELAGVAPRPAAGAPAYPPAVGPQAGYPGQAPYPPQPYYAGYDADARRLSGSATMAMWFGIVSVVGALCCAPIGIGFGIAAIIKGRGARGAPNNGAALAGVICGSIGLALGLLALIVNIVQFPEIMRQVREMQQQQKP